MSRSQGGAMPTSSKTSLTFLLCGNEDTGRRCLKRRYIANGFHPIKADPFEFDPEASHRVCLQHGGISHMVNFEIYPVPLSVLEDAASAWKGAAVLLLVYAVNNRESFDAIAALNIVDKWNEDPVPFKVVVATHADLTADDWHVRRQEGQELAKRLGAEYAATSAVSGEGVKELFESCAMKIIDRRDEEQRLRNTPAQISPAIPAVSDGMTGFGSKWQRIWGTVRRHVGR